jgi:hypothetical protein
VYNEPAYVADYFAHSADSNEASKELSLIAE